MLRLSMTYGVNDPSSYLEACLNVTIAISSIATSPHRQGIMRNGDDEELEEW